MQSLWTWSAVRVAIVLAISSCAPGSGDPGFCETWRSAGTVPLGKRLKSCRGRFLRRFRTDGDVGAAEGAPRPGAGLCSPWLCGAASRGAAPLPGGVPAECCRPPRPAAGELRCSAPRGPAAPSVVSSRLSWTAATCLHRAYSRRPLH